MAKTLKIKTDNKGKASEDKAYLGLVRRNHLGLPKLRSPNAGKIRAAKLVRIARANAKSHRRDLSSRPRPNDREI
jgi:hypothetical protein